MTTFYNLADIVVKPNRQRKEFDPAAMQELAESLQDPEIGLLHAPVIRAEGGKPVLVAGERRCRAVADIYELGGTIYYEGKPVEAGKIPCNYLGELSPVKAMEAELEENIRRVDLTWQERASATAALAALRKAQAVESGLPASSVTVATIAEEVRGSSEGSAHEATRKEIILAKHLDDPEVKAAKTPKEAFKILQRKEQVQRNVELAAQVGETFKSSDHTCLNMDSMVWLNDCPDGAFDVILTDPPYGMGADEFGDSGGACGGGHFYKDTSEHFYELMGKFIPESYRIAKEEAHLYVFCDLDKFHFLREGFANAGWTVFRTPLIWYKPAAFRAPWPESGPQRKYEILLYAKKGDRKVQRLFPDVITCAPDANIGHNAQKPVDLFIDLLKRSVRPGDTVLDLFCGSGPIFPAAHALQCTATGVELDPAAYALAIGRIKELK